MNRRIIKDLPSLFPENMNHPMKICNGDWRSEWVAGLEEVLRRSEKAELTLSYSSPCQSEDARKKVGAYYTPADAAAFFWNEFMVLNGIPEEQDIKAFWQEHHFIEPASGAGILMYALLKKVVELGLPLDCLSSAEITLIDINPKALDFARDEIRKISKKWDFSFSDIRYVCTDFLNYTPSGSSKKPLFFGNPPYVANPKGSRWKNSFADFLERALTESGEHGSVHFILPLSVAFSRDYVELRSMIRNSGKSVAISSFDNIPDCLFSSGKPKHKNTNKANSQRCSIVTVFPEDNPRTLSTRMHRWRKKDRSRLLNSTPCYHDITEYNFGGQFLRPENAAILNLLKDAHLHPPLKTILAADGIHSLYISGVARNFMGFREHHSSGVLRLRFKTEVDLYKAVLIMSSDLFLDYWRTVGDGFHLTRTNLENFPLHPLLVQEVDANISRGKSIWEARTNYAKSKRHPAGMTISYDLTKVALKISSKF